MKNPCTGERFYQCRHTFATRLAAAGASDTTIDQLMGHSRRGVLRFYTVRVLEYLRDAVVRLSQLLTEKTEMSAALGNSGIAPQESGCKLVN